LRALVIQHEQSTPGGYIDPWLDQRGADRHVLRIDVDDRELDPRDFELIVSLGSDRSAFDDSIPWIERERMLLREAVAADVPILGVCFGSQLLARALGGGSYRAEAAEIGWLRVSTRDRSLVSEGPWFQWHFDTFTPPPGAELIAHTPSGPQAFTIGRSLGVQFHPEVTPEIVQGWITSSGDELEGEGVDPDRLLQETRRRAGDSSAAAGRLFDAFLHRVVGVPD
jgi:GMP synthase-like glutamine amidotransferase